MRKYLLILLIFCSGCTTKLDLSEVRVTDQTDNNLGASNELINERTFKSKTFQKPDGSKTLKVYSSDIHYKNASGDFTDTDFVMKDMGAYWQMAKASYRLFINKQFNNGDLIRFDNRYEGANHSIYYNPQMLAWVNSTDLSDIQVFRNSVNVSGVLTSDDRGSVVTYKDAFGAGIDFEITLLSTGFQKEIVVNHKGDLELPPTASHKLVAFFKYRGDGLSVKSNDDGTVWDNNSYLESSSGFEIRESNSLKETFIRPAYIYDSAHNIQPIKVFWKFYNGNLYQAKVLPKAFLTDAIYPVRADTTSSFTSGTQDGGLIGPYLSSYSSVRSATSSLGTRLSTTILAYANRDGTLKYQIERGFHVFDTSSLTSSATISSSTFVFYREEGGSAAVGLNIGTTSWDGVTTLANTDFPKVDLSSPGTMLATTATTSANGTGALNLNATGLSNINKTGNTVFSIRDYRDMANSTPTNNTYMGYYSADNTTNKPYLLIDYTVSGSSATTKNNTLIINFE